MGPLRGNWTMRVLMSLLVWSIYGFLMGNWEVVEPQGSLGREKQAIEGTNRTWRVHFPPGSVLSVFTSWPVEMSNFRCSMLLPWWTTSLQAQSFWVSHVLKTLKSGAKIKHPVVKRVFPGCFVTATESWQSQAFSSTLAKQMHLANLPHARCESSWCCAWVALWVPAKQDVELRLL